MAFGSRGIASPMTARAAFWWCPCHSMGVDAAAAVDRGMNERSRVGNPATTNPYGQKQMHPKPGPACVMCSK